MPCYHPLKGYKGRVISETTGKRPVVFNSRDGYSDMPVSVPCGRCIGCRIDRSRQWAVRCVHEASLYERNCFITLTFDDNHLPPGGSLVKKDFQLFMKRLRQFACRNVWVPVLGEYVELPRKYWIRGGVGIRYFHCGEYGEQLGRPHHHACIFNFNFADRYLWKERDGVRLYRSKALESLWSDGKGCESYGYCTIAFTSYKVSCGRT